MARTIFAIYVSLISFNTIIGQENLIPNPSFEDLVSCPLPIIDGQLSLCPNWSNALGSADVWNSCAGSSVATFGMPLNSHNCYQYARTGNGYAGLQNYKTLPRTTEYMQVALIEALKPGKEYFVQFYVSPRNCAGPYICYSDGMGLAFSETFYYEDVIVGAEQIPPFTPAIQNPEGNILKDTLNWIEISGCYSAVGTERFAIIGNFRSNENTQSENCIGVTGSYHFIDDVGVYEYDPLPDTIILCNGENRTIGNSFLDATYQWNTGNTDSTITVNTEGEYIVNTMIGDCILRDTVVVLEIDKLLNSLQSDTFLCKGETLEINIPIKGNYTWSNGAVSNHISIHTAGIYTVSIENSCGTFFHSFEVTNEVCDCNVFVPNVFTPNNDGNNDFLNCFISCDFPYQSRTFQVFNRWGSLVYSNNSNNIDTINWDGSLRGKPLQAGVYVWIFKYEYTRNGVVNKKTVSGDVSIIK